MADDRRQEAMLAMRAFLEATTQILRNKKLEPIEAKLTKHMERAFDLQAGWVLHELIRHRGEFAEAMGDADIERIMHRVDIETSTFMAQGITKASEDAIMTAAREQWGVNAANIAFDFNLKSPGAMAYLKKNAALRVTQINETTKETIARIVTQGMDDGWSYNKTAEEISSRFAEFSTPKPQQHIESRAHLVAVNETGIAYEAGSRMTVDRLSELGLEMEKHWLTSGDDLVSDECAENEDEGWIPIGQDHKSGHPNPCRFPGCRCTEQYRRRQKE